MEFSLEKPPATAEIKKSLLESAGAEFLGDARDAISGQAFTRIVSDIEAKQEILKSEMESTANKRVASYDKYKKNFTVEKEKATMGQILSARHLGIHIALPESLESSGDGKKIRKLSLQYQTNDLLYPELNKELASNLAEKIRRQDLLKSKAYEEIAKRSGVESKQLGVLAENIMIGVAEMISIDRPDLGITVSPANAYQDVEEKIDFIIATKQKKRGVGAEAKDLPPEMKSVGVQFTINTAKREHKAEQIAKAKERGVQVDDIVYVAIEKKVLEEAITNWNKAGKPISGPWAYLPKGVREATLKGLFNGVLTEEQEKSLVNNF